MAGENPQEILLSCSAPSVRIRDDGWWLPRADKVPELGSPEHMRLAGYHDGMTPLEKLEFCCSYNLRHQLHGYE